MSRRISRSQSRKYKKMTPEQRKARLQQVIERRRKSLESKPKSTMSTKTVDMSRSPELIKKRVAKINKDIKEKKRINMVVL